MECIDNPSIKYEKFLYKLGVKKKDDVFGYFTSIIEREISLTDIENEKEKFLESYKSKDCIKHSKYCIEYTVKDEIYLEYIMGFVALK